MIPVIGSGHFQWRTSVLPAFVFSSRQYPLQLFVSCDPLGRVLEHRAGYGVLSGAVR